MDGLLYLLIAVNAVAIFALSVMLVLLLRSTAREENWEALYTEMKRRQHE